MEVCKDKCPRGNSRWGGDGPQGPQGSLPMLATDGDRNAQSKVHQIGAGEKAQLLRAFVLEEDLGPVPNTLTPISGDPMPSELCRHQVHIYTHRQSTHTHTF